MVPLTSELNGLEKASVLLMSIGSAASAEVLKHLSPAERELLGAHIVQMRPVQSVVRQRVLEEVGELVSRSDAQEPEPASEPGAPLKWLERLEPMEVAKTLSKERPHSVALVMAHLAPASAASVLSYMDEKLRGSVLQRLSTMGPVSEEAVKAVDELLRERARKKSETREEGKQASEALLKVFGDATSRARESVLGALARKEPQMPECLSASWDSPEDIAALSDVEIRDVLREVDMEDVSLALGVATEPLRDAVLRNLPEGLASAIRASFEGQFQIKVRDIEAAQARIVEVLRRLAGDGRIGRSNEAREAAA